jgi:hypothetical protein
MCLLPFSPKSICHRLRTTEQVLSRFAARAQEYAFGGSCCVAASETVEWLNIKGTEAQRLTGVLKTTPGRPDNITARVTRQYKLEADCIWILEEEHDEQLVEGAKHDVVLAELAEGSKVVDFCLNSKRRLLVCACTCKR